MHVACAMLRPPRALAGQIMPGSRAVKADATHSIASDSCRVKEYLVKLNRYRTTWCPTSATGENSPRSSRTPIFPTSVPASPSQLAVTTGRRPAVKMVRHPSHSVLRAGREDTRPPRRTAGFAFPIHGFQWR